MMKTFDFNSLVFLWLLPLAASDALTSGWHNMVTDNSTNQSQPTTHMSVSLNPTADSNPLEKTSPPSLQTAQSETTPESTRTSTPESTTSNESNRSLRPETASTAGLPSSQPSTAPPMQSSSTNTEDAVTYPSTSNPTSSLTPPSEIFTSHLTTSVKTEDGYFTSTQATRSTKKLMPYKTTTFRSTSQTTKRTNKQQEKKESNSGKIVAGLIGGALALMMVGFLAIYIRKRRIQKQQTMVTDWAGPSPFLQDEGNGGQVTQRPANRISIASFLPHRLSKRLSLLNEMDQELKDMPPAFTFGHEVQVKDAKDSNGSSASDTRSLGETGVPTESPSSVISSKNPNAAPEDPVECPAKPANA